VNDLIVMFKAAVVNAVNSGQPQQIEVELDAGKFIVLVAKMTLDEEEPKP
jgi:hypothetical protein